MIIAHRSRIRLCWRPYLQSLLPSVSIPHLIFFRCELMSHVKTQLPYSVLAGVVGVLVGNLPIGSHHVFHFLSLIYSSSHAAGYEAYPNVVGIVIGLFTVFVITYFLAEKIDSNATDKVPSFRPRTLSH